MTDQVDLVRGSGAGERGAAIGLDVDRLAQARLLACGALGAVIVGSWLVEAKQSVIDDMAPVLTRLVHAPVRRRAPDPPGDDGVGAGGSFTALERWQTAHLPVYAIWAAIVVGPLFPPVFGYR